MIIIGLLQVFLLCSIFQVMTEDASLPPDLRLRARGAASNAAGRFEAHGVCYEPDGWDRDEEARVLRTQVSEERPPDHQLQPLARSAVRSLGQSLSRL